MQDKIIVIDEIEDILNHGRTMYYAWYSVFTASLIGLILVWFQVRYPLSLLIIVMASSILFFLYILILESIVPVMLSVKYEAKIVPIRGRHNVEIKVSLKPVYLRPFVTIILPCKIKEKLYEFKEIVDFSLSKAVDQCIAVGLSREYLRNINIIGSPIALDIDENKYLLRKLEDTSKIQAFGGEKAIESLHFKSITPLWRLPYIKKHQDSRLITDVIIVFPRIENYTFIFIYVYLDEKTMDEIWSRCLFPALLPIFYGRAESFLKELKQYVKIIEENLIREIERHVHDICRL